MKYYILLLDNILGKKEQKVIFYRIYNGRRLDFPQMNSV